MAVLFGPFALATRSRRLTRAGHDLHLTPKAFDLLVLLAEAAPSVVSKTEIHRRLWPDSFVADTTLVGLVKEVRRVLGDTDPEAPIIRTVSRVGYAFACAVDASSDRRPARGHWLVADGQSFSLQSGRNVIGREPAAAVWLDSGGVSRRHAAITIAEHEAHLEDLGSKNGTRVNDLAVAHPVTLRDGDRLLIGTVPLTYRSSASSASTETRVGSLGPGPAFEQ